VTNPLQLLFENCLFMSNYGLTPQFKRIENVTLTNSRFCNNTLLHPDQRLFVFGKTVVFLKQYNEISFNTANAIISLQKYILLTEGANLNVSYNRAKSNDSNLKVKYRSLITTIFHGTLLHSANGNQIVQLIKLPQVMCTKKLFNMTQ